MLSFLHDNPVTQDSDIACCCPQCVPTSYRQDSVHEVRARRCARSFVVQYTVAV